MPNQPQGILSFTVIGDEGVKAGMAALLASVQDLTPFWRDVFAPKYFGMVQDLFATSGTPRGEGGRFIGGPWAKLSPRYRIWKTANYPGLPILTREGRLRNSLAWNGSNVGPEGIFEAHPMFAVAGTSVPYGKFHQWGTSKMPARPFLPPPDPAVFAPLLHAWLVKAHDTGSASAPSAGS
jgi:phage gpG-like protein